MTVEQIKERGEFVHAYLNQGRVWINVKGERVPVRSIDADYAQNILRFIEKRARWFAWNYGVGEAMSIGRLEAAFGAPDDFDIPSKFEEYIDNDLGLVKSTALYRSIEKRTKTRPLT